MGEITIRSAELRDGMAIVELVLDLAEERGAAARSATSLTQAVAGCLSTPNHEIWVAEADGRVVGYAAVHWIPFPMIYGTEGYLSDLLVHQDARGKGVGQLLLAQIEARAEELGCVRLMLNNARTAESFTRGFYPKQGYRERTEFANFVKPLK